MADEVLDAPQGAAETVVATESQEQPSLRDTIAAAVAKQREPEAPKAEEPVKSEAKPDGDRARDESGRFAKTEPKAETSKPEEAAKADPQPEDPQKAADEALRPPTSWSPTAKAAFNELPQPVKDAIFKREQEVNNGFAKLAEYKPLDQWIDLAKQSGTDLNSALQNYRSIELRLEQDFVGGIAHLAQRQNFHPVQLAQAILSRFGVSPQNGEAAVPQAHQQAQVDLSPIHEELRALRDHVTQQEMLAVNSEIDRFASDAKQHPYFANVKADMGRLIETGQAQNLEDAYDMACWANKEIRALLIKQQAMPQSAAKAEDAVQRAKAADKATGGAPAAGFSPAGPKVAAGASIRDTIRAAVDAQRGV
ncbi:hypothetical protein [Bradyrhizobium sp. USDA 4452]